MLVFLLCLVASSEAAFTISSTFVETFLAPSQNPSFVNQTVEWQQNTVTFQCSATNQEDNSLQIGNTCYDITCNAPLYSYDVTLRGFVPAFGTLYSTEICLVDKQQALQGFNATATPPPLPPDVPAGRRLLSFLDSLSSAFDNYVGGVVCTASLGFAGNCDNNNGGSGLDQYARDALMNQANKLNQYIANMTIWQTATTNTLSDISTVNQGITATLQNQQSQLNTINAFGTQLNNTVYALAQHTDVLAAQVNSDFQSVYRNISFLGSSLVQTDSKVQKLQNYAVANFQIMANTSAKQQANQNAQNIQFFQKIHGVTRLVKVLANAVRQQALLTNVKHAITAAIFGQALVAESKGEILLVHPAFPGQAPASFFPQSLLQTTLDKMFLSFTNSTGGQNTNHQFGINVYCNLDRVQLYGFDTIDYEDVFDIIGPVGCSAGGSSAALSNCLCWIQVTHQFCQARTGFRWDSIQSQNRADFVLQPSMCLNGNTVPTVDTLGWDGRLFDSIALFNKQILGPICGLSLSSAIPPLQFNLFSTRVGYMNMPQTPLSQQSTVCALDLYVVFESTQFGATMPFNVIRTMTIAYSAMLADDNPVLQYEYGFQPNYVTYTQLPFRSMPNNQTYTCYRASIMGVAPTTKPVFTVTPSVGQEVTTTVSVVARDCNTQAIVSSSITSTGIVPSVPLTSVLPQAGDAIFDIIHPQGFLPPTSIVYDYPRGSATVGGPRQTRAGHITYPMQPIPPGFNIANVNQAFPPTAMMDTQIALDNGALYFNHEDAAFTLDNVAVPFQFDSGAHQQLCVPPAGHVTEWLCAFLDSWVLDPLTDFRQGKLVAKPDSWTYEVTANVNMGEVIQRVYAGCPEISFSTFKNGQIDYTLTNSLPNEITSTVRVLSTSHLCANPGDLVVDLLPKQVYTKTISTCGNMTIQIFQPKIPGPGLQACTAPIALNVNPNSQANLPPSTNVFNQTFVVDTFVQQTTAVILAAASLFTNLAPLLTPTLTPNLTTIERSDLITTALINFIAQAQQFGNANFVGNQTAIQIYQQYLPALNNISATFHQQAVQGQAMINNLTIENAKVKADVAQVKIDLNHTIIAQLALTAANNEVIDALSKIKDGTTPIEPCPDCPHIPFIYQMCCAIINIAQFLANILLYVAIIVAIVAAAFGIYRLIRYCQAKRAEESQDQETEKLVHQTQTEKAKLNQARASETSSSSSLRRTRE